MPPVMKFQGDSDLDFGGSTQQLIFLGLILGHSVVAGERLAAINRLIESTMREQNRKTSFLICIAVVLKLKRS